MLFLASPFLTFLRFSYTCHSPRPRPLYSTPQDSHCGFSLSPQETSEGPNTESLSNKGVFVPHGNTCPCPHMQWLNSFYLRNSVTSAPAQLAPISSFSKSNFRGSEGKNPSEINFPWVPTPGSPAGLPTTLLLLARQMYPGSFPREDCASYFVCLNHGRKLLCTGS